MSFTAPIFYGIDPTVDCVFKALFSRPGNENLLIDFLNSILQPKVPIAEVRILNPHNDKRSFSDKFSIVDVLAIDQQDKRYQVEVQLTSPGYMPKRMLYTWASIYTEKIEKGDEYHQLQPVISIWILNSGKFLGLEQAHCRFNIIEQETSARLTDDFELHVLQLNKWHKPRRLLSEDFWLYFFKEAKDWQQVPAQMRQVNWLEQAMKVLQGFSERERDALLYESRLDAQRVLISDEYEKKKEREGRIAAEAKAEQEREARLAAEVKAEQEREARLAAEAKALAAVEELERLKADLEK